MRVIAGQAKGRRLKGPSSRGGRRGPGASTTRPTSDLVRESMFSTLASMGADLSRVVDLYAGSGALGIEALSRGAGHCDFVERQRSACELIGENLRSTGLDSSATVFCLPVHKALEKLEGVYTLVLADPPYEDETALYFVEEFAKSPVVKQGRTVIVLEHSAREEPKAAIGTFSLVSSRRHGDTAVSIYR
jgi:16S rRNA (guanine966-N2)-methyltransferase